MREQWTRPNKPTTHDEQSLFAWLISKEILFFFYNKLANNTFVLGF
jgi:hypothetical protein